MTAVFSTAVPAVVAFLAVSAGVLVAVVKGDAKAKKEGS